MKVYIGNLPFSATEEELRAKFGAHGTLTEVALIADRDTGRPRGFGFVTFETAEGAKAAIAALNGTDMGGRNLKVNEAQDRPKGGGGGGGGGARGGRDRY